MAKFKKGDRAKCLAPDFPSSPGDIVDVVEIGPQTNVFKARLSSGISYYMNGARWELFITPTTPDPVAYVKSRLEALKGGDTVVAGAMRDLLRDILQHGHGITARLETVTTRTWVFEDASAKDAAS